jgi:hypothetical protein
MVALVIFEFSMVEAEVAKFKIPTKSLLLRVFTTLIAASLARLIRSPSIEPDVSIIKIKFLAPEEAVTYQGLNLGS